jgi:hypothetical protein
MGSAGYNNGQRSGTDIVREVNKNLESKNSPKAKEISETVKRETKKNNLSKEETKWKNFLETFNCK